MVGDDDDILAVCSVGPHRIVGAAPHLIAVSLEPVGREAVLFQVFDLVRTAAGGLARHLEGGHLGYPVCGNHLLAGIFASLQQGLSHAGHVFGLEVQSPSAAVDSLGAFFPFGLHDSQRLPQAGSEIVIDLFPGDLLHDGRKHVCAVTVVDIPSSGLVLDRCCEEGLRPRSAVARSADRRLLVLAYVHGEQVPDRGGSEVLAYGVGQILREEGNHLVVQFELALGDGEAYRGRSEGLAYRPHDVGLFGRFAVEPLFCKHFSVLEHHHAVQGPVGVGLAPEYEGVDCRGELFGGFRPREVLRRT